MKQLKQEAWFRGSRKQPEEAIREGMYVSEVVYNSRVEVESVEGKVRRAHIPAKEDPVFFGVHSEIAQNYTVSLPILKSPIPARSTTWSRRPAADCSGPSEARWQRVTFPSTTSTLIPPGR